LTVKQVFDAAITQKGDVSDVFLEKRREGDKGNRSVSRGLHAPVFAVNNTTF
jgi:hypothetical protein